MEDLLHRLNDNYPVRFDKIEFAREGGTKTYIAFAGRQKYFLRSTAATAKPGTDIHVFLQNRGFPVPLVILTNDSQPYVQDGTRLHILYEYLQGSAADPIKDAKAVGTLTGQLHALMKEYPGELVNRDKLYYIGRYVNHLRERKYPKAEAFAALGETLWQRLKDLPRGYCHGDLYCGNVLKTPEGKLYFLDFDTSCMGFPLYDAALFCNGTDYFQYKRVGFAKSQRAFAQFMPAYLEHCKLEQANFSALCEFIAVYHFALQANIIELFGSNCVDHHFFDRQLNWLSRWQKEYH